MVKCPALPSLRLPQNLYMPLSTALKRLAALLCSAALIAWFIFGGQREAQFAALAARLARLDAWQIAGFIAAFGCTYLLRAGRVFDEFRSVAGVRFGAILRLTLIHNAMINVLPFRSGEATFPLLLTRWFGVPTTRAVAALLWLRLQDAFVVLALAAAVWPGLPLWLRLLWVAGVALAAWLIPTWARSHPELLPEHGRFARIGIRLRAALAESTRGSRRAWLWTLANWSLKLLAQAWMLAVLLGDSVQTGLAGALGVELASILPIQGVAGFGTYEAGGAALLRAHGIMLADGLQAALVLHLFVIACALCAGALAAVLLPGAIPQDQPQSSQP
jgi:Lysylphosphatidylglycerol synthase TM region